ncbi:polysaccharide pyruvyl transferase family protein [Nesterenkonia aurantiaca]|uniref:polysaccharide pyruvyl transferase family protein n=1 Tax=Nesterenkonia aurantiaca TaxID=1436010 RepID=UPI003EE7EA32
MHRRKLLDWLRPCGDVHVLVGDAPDSFLSGLHLDGTETVYSNIWSWLSVLARDVRSAPWVVFNPGEFRLGSARAIREMTLAPLLASVSQAGGRILRVGVAAGSHWKFDNKFSQRVILSSLNRTSTLLWRESRSRELVDRGEVIPDLAFGLSSDIPPRELQQRPKLAVTMRGDRPFPSADWIRAIRSYGLSRDLSIVVTSQVRRDNVRSVELADALGGKPDPWPEDRDHARQEDHVRELYRNSSMLVSDRLHGLIAAATEGAVPVGLIMGASEKIPTHFREVGLNVGLDSTALTEAQISAHLSLHESSRGEVVAAVVDAQARLERARESIARLAT